MPKTLVLFQDEYIDAPPKFFELEGDYRCYDKVYINTAFPDDTDLVGAEYTAAEEEFMKKQTDLNDLVYDEIGRIKLPILTEPTKDWDYFICCGFLP